MCTAFPTPSPHDKHAFGADCIYHEHIIEGLLETCLCLCSPKTTGALTRGQQ